MSLNMYDKSDIVVTEGEMGLRPENKELLDISTGILLTPSFTVITAWEMENILVTNVAVMNVIIICFVFRIGIKKDLGKKSDDNGRPMAAPTIATVVNQMKGIVSKQVGISVWQKGFYDHMIRGDADYREVGEYIENNPGKWAEDKLLQDILSDKNGYSYT